ncbi:hypothetical protein AOLI_G00081380 [Acnodon oligacanthus]
MPAPTNRTELGNPKGRGERSWWRWYECRGLKKDIGALRQLLLSWANWILLVEMETHSQACGPIRIAVVLPRTEKWFPWEQQRHSTLQKRAEQRVPFSAVRYDMLDFNHYKALNMKPRGTWFGFLVHRWQTDSCRAQRGGSGTFLLRLQFPPARADLAVTVCKQIRMSMPGGTVAPCATFNLLSFRNRCFFT